MIYRMDCCEISKRRHMQLVDLFPAERIFLGVTVSNRQELIAFLSERAGALGLASGPLCAGALGAREELGSTGLGNGIAIPHARIEGLERTLGLLAVLAKPIDFDAVDQEPVDVVLMLLMPAQSGNEPIKQLSRIAKMARQERVIADLRRAASVEDVLEILRDAERDDDQP